MPDAIAFIALGSNLGDPAAHLDRAIALLRLQPGLEVVTVSSYYETAPVGGPAGQANYRNAVALVRTALAPLHLLRVLQGMENQQGRVRAERFGPRTLDLDLLLYDTEVVSTDELTVPHPRMHERAFVLEPLVEIAPLAVHPVLQSTAKDLLHRLHESTRPGQPRRELAGQKAVITGSTSGIGKAIALELADAGADVLIHGRRSLASAENVAAECRTSGVLADAILADLSDVNACVSFVDRVLAAWPTIDHWIQCAGADTLTGEAAKWPFERKLEVLWAVDVRATIQITRAIGARMKRQGHGTILTVGWDQAETGMEGDSGQLFGACKGAVMAYTKSLALEMAPDVRVNCLTPGWIRTAWGENASEAWQTRVLRETPLERWGTPEDVAQTARWLCSPAARFITGQIIRINGGAIR